VEPIVAASAHLHVKLLHPAARAPVRVRPGDAAYDLCSVEDFSLDPRQRAIVSTGVALALPPGIAGLVIPRSGLAARHGLSVVNGPGLIDPNYRGEIRLVLVNLGEDPFVSHAGDRLAQLLLITFWAPEISIVEDLPESTDERGINGFGSSGR